MRRAGQKKTIEPDEGCGRAGHNARTEGGKTLRFQYRSWTGLWRDLPQGGHRRSKPDFR